VINTEEYDDT